VVSFLASSSTLRTSRRGCALFVAPPVPSRTLAIGACKVSVMAHGIIPDLCLSHPHKQYTHRSHHRLGLLNTYKSIFNLKDEYLSEIKTPDQLFDYLGELSESSRLLQPLSSFYFVEETGEMKVLQGVRRFLESESIEVEGLEPKIDSEAFSMMAWVKLKAGSGANVLRKPLGKGPGQRDLSCWAWYVGYPADRFDFGAHDFRGGMSATGLQETVSAGGSVVSDGKLHMVSIIVNQTTLSFYTDAVLQKVVPLGRPITDCSGRALLAGAPDIPRLGEITFFPRQLSVMEMGEIITSGFTFESLAAGKEAFKPVKTQFDVSTARQTEAFAVAQGERSLAGMRIQVENAFNRLVTANFGLQAVPEPTPKIIVPARQPSCPVVPIFGDATSCHIMGGFNATTDAATTGNTSFLPMLEPAYRNNLGGKDRIWLDHNSKKQYLRYDAQQWPSFCGTSATFSMWIENWDCGARSTLIARYPKGDSKRAKGAWFYQMDQDPGGTKCCIGQIPARGMVAHWKCAILEPVLNCMGSMTRRHLAVVSALALSMHTLRFE